MNQRMGNWPEVAVVQLSDSSENLIESIENFIESIEKLMESIQNFIQKQFLSSKKIYETFDLENKADETTRIWGFF